VSADTARRVLVIGATGDVGNGVTAAFLEAGWSVVASSRREDSLGVLASKHEGADLNTIRGDLDTETDARALAAAAGQLDAVVVTISLPWDAGMLTDLTFESLNDHFTGYLRPHTNAAKAFIPTLKEGATYLAVGGGTADFITPGNSGMSIAQAAQRVLVLAWSRERKGKGVVIRELMIQAAVEGYGEALMPGADVVKQIEVGRRAVEIVEHPELKGTVLTIPPRAGEA
jgi:NAD(P)-dependent dehydrogenase (short-subunit alcohol dehydrogenase family)